MTILDIGGDPDPAADPVSVGMIGCGSHTYRNVLPTVQFTDLDLVACCDLDASRAAAYADQFGADRSYDDHRTMLAEEDLQAVLVVLDYDDDGRPQYPPIAIDAMEAGCDVWIEKPPAASADEIESMRAVEETTGRFVQVGYKKCFTPAVEHVHRLTARAEFGSIESIVVRYPLAFPDRASPGDSLSHGPDHVGLLDHLVHPGSILAYLGGPMDRCRLAPARNGGGFLTVAFRSGAVGTIHMAAGSSGRSPLERVEVVGAGANVVLENGVDVTYYPPGNRGQYGREPDFVKPDEPAAHTWRPEFSLGQLYNKNLFTLGYYAELQQFAAWCAAGAQPSKAGTAMSHELLALYEAVLAGGDGWIELESIR